MAIEYFGGHLLSGCAGMAMAAGSDDDDDVPLGVLFQTSPVDIVDFAFLDPDWEGPLMRACLIRIYIHFDLFSISCTL